ncbi:MAG: hypothetical protein AAGD05_11260, partial [Bacteroidota bacterium]
MFLEHQHFDLSEKAILHRVVFRPPLRIPVTMNQEACFVFAVNAQGDIYSSTGHALLNRSEGVVLKCGNYLHKWTINRETDIFEVLIIRFYPEILQ